MSDEVKYLCKLVVPAVDASIEAALLTLPSYHEMEALSDELQIDDELLLISSVGSQEALLEGISMYEDVGMNVLLGKVTDYKGSGNVLDSLTDRQQELLHTAYDRDYFDVPRRSSATDIAKELDRDASTVSEHLQQAQRNLLTPFRATGSTTAQSQW